MGKNKRRKRKIKRKEIGSAKRIKREERHGIMAYSKNNLPTTETTKTLQDNKLKCRITNVHVKSHLSMRLHATTVRKHDCAITRYYFYNQQIKLLEKNRYGTKVFRIFAV